MSKVSCWSVRSRFTLMFRFLFTEIVLLLCFSHSVGEWIVLISFACVFGYVCRCGVSMGPSSFLCVYMHSGLHTTLQGEARCWHQYLPQSLSTFLIKTGSPTEPGLLDLAILAGQEASGLCLYPSPQCWDYGSSADNFYVGAEDANSGAHTCAAGTLL